MTGIGWCDSGHFFMIAGFLSVRLISLAIGAAAHVIGRYRVGNAARRHPYQRNHVVLVCALSGLNLHLCRRQRLVTLWHSTLRSLKSIVQWLASRAGLLPTAQIHRSLDRSLRAWHWVSRSGRANLIEASSCAASVGPHGFLLR